MSGPENILCGPNDIWYKEIYFEKNLDAMDTKTQEDLGNQLAVARKEIQNLR